MTVVILLCIWVRRGKILPTPVRKRTKMSLIVKVRFLELKLSAKLKKTAMVNPI